MNRPRHLAPSPAGRRAIGVALVVAVCAGLVLGTLRPDPFADTVTVRAVFDEAKGLAKVERDVRMGGVNVGRIGAVRRVGQDAEIELVLDAGKAGPVYGDATAELRPHHAFEGSAFIDLHPGSAGAGRLGDRVIPAARTRVYVALDESLRGLDAPRRASLTAVAGELRDATTPQAQQDLRTTIEQLPALTRDAASTARALRGPTGRELRPAVRGFATAARVAARRSVTVRATIRDARRTLTVLDQGPGGSPDRTLAAVPGALTELRAGAGALQAVTARLRSLARDARPLLTQATPLLRETRPLLRRAVPALRDAPPLLRDLRLMLDDVARATPALRTVLRGAGGIVRDLDEKALPQAHAPSRLGRPAFVQFLAGGAGLTGMSATFQTAAQNPAGAGHFGRIGGNLLDGFLGQGDEVSGRSRCAQLRLLRPSLHRTLRRGETC